MFFFDVFMHFELLVYADDAVNLFIEVWDSNDSEWTRSGNRIGRETDWSTDTWIESGPSQTLCFVEILFV